MVGNPGSSFFLDPGCPLHVGRLVFVHQNGTTPKKSYSQNSDYRQFGRRKIGIPVNLNVIIKFTFLSNPVWDAVKTVFPYIGFQCTFHIDIT